MSPVCVFFLKDLSAQTDVNKINMGFDLERAQTFEDCCILHSLCFFFFIMYNLHSTGDNVRCTVYIGNNTV